MPDHARLALVAERLINENGRTLEFFTPRPAGDNSKPWRGPDLDTPEDDPVEAIGVVLDYRVDEIDNDLVKRGDKYCLTRMGGEVDPRTFDRVVDGSETWRIVSVNTLTPGEVMMIHTLQLRQ